MKEIDVEICTNGAPERPLAIMDRVARDAVYKLDSVLGTTAKPLTIYLFISEEKPIEDREVPTDTVLWSGAITNAGDAEALKMLHHLLAGAKIRAFEKKVQAQEKRAKQTGAAND